MTEFPILRLRNPVLTTRRKRSPPKIPQPTGPTRYSQGQRFNPVFDRISRALVSEDPQVTLQQSPDGISPERALIFETAGPVQNFFRVAVAAGMEVFGEFPSSGLNDLPDGFNPPTTSGGFNRVLYATLPTLASFEKILVQWRRHQSGASPETNYAPWWKAFDLLIDLRPWGPFDRFPAGARAAVLSELPYDDDETTHLELEFWPTASAQKRETWLSEVIEQIQELGGSVIASSSLRETGFSYEGLLVALSAGSVRELVDNPASLDNLGTLDGVQYIFPQSIAQSISASDTDVAAVVAPNIDGLEGFEEGAPFKAALLDGVPVAAHPVLNGGIAIEDVNELVALSLVRNRHHATSMSSLILRGDLNDNGSPVSGARVVSIPVLIDHENSSSSPQDKLLVDLIHYTLTKMIVGDDAVAKDVFVVNFSVGMNHRRFGNQVGSLARLLDWWSAQHGILFVVSAGNILDSLNIPDIVSVDFERLELVEKKRLIREAIRKASYDRTLLSPSEALNVLTVGALSEHKGHSAVYASAGIICLENDGESGSSVSSAMGLGPMETIKPDVVVDGGLQELRVSPNLDNTLLKVVRGRRTGLKVASPNLSTTLTTGTSNAAAITTRNILECAESLMSDGGPFQGEELPRRDVSLLTRAIAINSAVWPESSEPFYDDALAEHGSRRHANVKKDVSKIFGFGALQPDRMTGSPEKGVTLVGLGTLRKDQGCVFKLPLPEDLSGDRVARSMRITLSWFTPVDIKKSSYRLAGLEAIASEAGSNEYDNEWFLKMGGVGPDSNMAKKGSVWSRRLVNCRLLTPEFGETATMPVKVQCRDVSGGGLSPDENIRFAIAITLEVENELRYDVFQQVKDKLRVRTRV